MMKMEEPKKCPICGKDGIPDFYQEDVVCPCCGSNLSIYRKINNLVEANDKRNNWERKGLNKVVWLLSFMALMLAMVCGSFLYLWKQSAKELVFVEKDKAQVNQRIIELKDSVEMLKYVIGTATNKSYDSKLVQSNLYVVKEGDSFYRISRKKLGTGNRYVEILSLNHLQATSILHVGDTLKMPER